MDHVFNMQMALGYALVGFFIAFLVAVLLDLFRVLPLPRHVRSAAYGTLLASLISIILAFFSGILKTPTAVQRAIENKVAEEVRQEVGEEVREVRPPTGAGPAPVPVPSPGSAPPSGPTRPSGSTPTPVTAPKLVYIQVAHREQRARAEQLQKRLRADGFAAPGIENAWNRSPDDLQVRHFADDLALAQQVARILESEGVGRAKLVQLDIGNRRTGAVEVWFPR